LHELEVTKLIASFSQTWKFHNKLQIEMAAQVLPRSDPYCGTNVPCGHMQRLASPKKVYFILLMEGQIVWCSAGEPSGRFDEEFTVVQIWESVW